MVVQIGQTLGRYRIIEKIGAGGMGVVYRAHDQRLSRDLAIKVLSPGSLDSSAARKRFRNEALVLSKLNHPAIQIIHDFDTIEDCDFLVSELVAGESLDARVAAGPLLEKEIARIGYQLAQGLGAAHAAGILHRDLKPANLKVTPDGHLKILDFGLATLSPEAIKHLSTTLSLADAPAAVGGTLPYMSPEQLLGNHVDERSDIYSSGVSLFELATSQVPFTELLVPRLTDAILHKSPRTPTELNRKISPELSRIILKCLEKDPELRYQSAKDLGVDLRRLEVSSSSKATEVIERSTEKKKLRVVATSAAVLAAVIIATVLMLGKLRSAKSEVIGLLTFEQLTNFADSATSPALSADGRMLTFIRGENTFMGPGQIYAKLLPNGEPVQLTHDGALKMSPIFSPNGDRVIYTSEEAGMGADTWSVPTLGGTASPMLVNASGLTWLPGADKGILFSEASGEGIHLGIVASGKNREGERKIYFPANVDGMAHRSYASPDGKWVLVVEMDLGGWLPCRLVPFDGSSSGRQVGPAGAQCTYAAWSPDGKWMYFSANVGKGFHIWRQAFPGGQPEQVTFGASEEQGISFAPDGRSFVTAIGSNQSTLWVRDKTGNRQITSEGYAFLPTFSRDEKKLYYLVRSGESSHFVSGELWVADLSTGLKQQVLPGSHMEHFDISDDDKTIVFITADATGRSPIWIASLDGQTPPHILSSIDSVRALFGPGGNIYFVGGKRGESFLYRIHEDGSNLEKILPGQVAYLYSISPDGKWAGLWIGASVVVQPLGGGTPKIICKTCGTAGEENRGVTPAMVRWSPDQKYVYLHFPEPARKTYAFALRPGQVLPIWPSEGLENPDFVANIPGARLITEPRATCGMNPAFYAFPRVTTQRNIYRVQLP